MDSKNHRHKAQASGGMRTSLSNIDYIHSSPSSDLSLRQITSPNLTAHLEDHNAINFKLIKTVADFTHQLSSIHEQHAEELQMLVETFRKRNAELRRERPQFHSTLFTSWEVLLQEVEVDSQVHGDIARSLGRQVGMMLLEKTFHRKIQSRKIFLHRESLETILSKAEELLNKCHQDYTEAYNNLISHRSHTKLAEYYDMHNAYVQQLHAANGMLEYYHKETLPKLLEELEDVYIDLSDTISGSILSAADMLVNKSREQSNHYENIATTAQSVKTRSDLANFIRSLNVEKLSQPSTKHLYNPPYMENDPAQMEPGMMLRDELVIDRLSQLPNRSQTLKQDVSNLEAQIKQLQEAVESLERLQKRSLESSLFNKANELQEDVSLKKFDLQVAHIHLAAVKAQLELFTSGKGEHPLEGNHLKERKQSTISTGSGTAKNKWLKAFLNLKTASSGNLSEKNESDKKNSKSGSRPLSAAPGTLEVSHVFQEYNYKKMTSCDYCNKVLRGHVKQGLRCKLCKVNVHSECQEKLTTPCQPKTKLLRRQKSTSEIETKIPVPEPEEERNNQQNVDPIYQLLKQAGDLGGNNPKKERSEKDFTLCGSPRDQSSGGRSNSSSLTSLQQQRWVRSNASSSASSSSSYLLTVSGNQGDHASTSAMGGNRIIVSAPHSPQRKRLSLRMKSFSLDSPESSEHVHRRQHHQLAPQSPIHGSRQHLLAAKNVRMSSVDLPDDNEKSLSSASTSPCPSPKPHRLLPTNLYVVLYNFQGRHKDEIDLKAGCIITVTDTRDPNWWEGKCMGRIGFFPSMYVTRLHPGEQPLQVIHAVHVSDNEGNSNKLLSDQIIIQVGDERDGMVMIRTGANDKTYSCPLKYLKEV
ncbi:guanine nucleotide exchange factor VAV2 isoform X2 [Parasteatoda tepidariorum]|uniref:guanine nucleotide exchange factor VAV2 isoform X2 n=1 Tax=Parasteatoda tepidariorum TaxID=114398 RepID=UPI000A2BFF7A